MPFSVYDILSKIIPGGVLFFVLNILFIDLELGEGTSLIAIYILGYFIDAIASLLERPVMFRLFGGNPAVKLMNGKGFLGIQLEDIETLSKIIETKDAKNNLSRLFSMFYNTINKKDYKRINLFLEQYVLSRNMLVSCFVSGIIYMSSNVSIEGFVLFGTILGLLFLRTKQRNYYFAKEVINSYLHETKKEKNVT